MTLQSRKRRLRDEESPANQSDRPLKLADSGNSFNASSASVATSSRHQQRVLLPRPPLASVSGNSQGFQPPPHSGRCVLDTLVQQAILANEVVKMGVLARKIKSFRLPNAQTALGYTVDQMIYSNGTMTALFREWVQLFSLRPGLLDLASSDVRQMFEFQKDMPASVWYSIENSGFTSADYGYTTNCGLTGETIQATQTYTTDSSLSGSNIQSEAFGNFDSQGTDPHQGYPNVSCQLDPGCSTTSFDAPQTSLSTGILPSQNNTQTVSLGQGLANAQPIAHNPLAINPDLELARPAWRTSGSVPGSVSGSVSGSASSSQNQITTPPGNKRLSRGRTLYQFSSGEKRVFHEILGQDLPQEAENGKTHDLESFCPPPNVDISLLDFNVSAEELLTFFPRHTMWYAIANRLSTHDWSARTVIQYIHSMRDLGDANCVQRTTMEKRLTAAKAWKSESPPKVISANPSHMSNKWGQKSRSPPHMDYFVVDLTEGLNEPKLPETGRLTLSRVVQHVLENDNRDLRLSEVNEYARQHGLLVPDNGYDVKAEDANAAKSLAGKSRADFVAKFNARLA